MSASRLRITADAAGRLIFVVMVCLAAGCQPATPPAKPAPPASAASKAPEGEGVAEKEARPQKILIFAAASTQELVETISREFESSHPGVEISGSFASSVLLAKQIAEGAPADLFFSASPQWVKFLSGEGMVADERDLLGNELVVVVPAESTLVIEKPEDLLTEAVEHIALGDPESVPAGIYGKQALSKLGLWEKLHDKVVGAGDVREALAMVETGAAEAGIVYATDAAVSKKVKLALAFDSKLTEPIVYTLALIKRNPGIPAARELYDYFQSAEAAAIFRQAGFRVQPAAGVPDP